MLRQGLLAVGLTRRLGAIARHGMYSRLISSGVDGRGTRVPGSGPSGNGARKESDANKERVVADNAAGDLESDLFAPENVAYVLLLESF
jgi:hypothetical protein